MSRGRDSRNRSGTAPASLFRRLKGTGERGKQARAVARAEKPISCEGMRVMWLVTGVCTRSRERESAAAVEPLGERFGGPGRSGKEKGRGGCVREAFLAPLHRGGGGDSELRPGVIAI